MPDGLDPLGTDWILNPNLISGIATGDPIAIKSLIATGLNFVPVLGPILGGIAALLPFPKPGTVHPTYEQTQQIANQVTDNYIAMTDQASVNWLADLGGGKLLYKAVVDQIQGPVWAEGKAAWGGGWIRNESYTKYYDRIDLGTQYVKGSGPYAREIVKLSIWQLIANLVGELDAATMTTQGVQDIAYYMTRAVEPLNNALAAGIGGITGGATLSQTFSTFFSSTTAVVVVAVLVAGTAGYFILRKKRRR